MTDAQNKLIEELVRIEVDRATDSFDYIYDDGEEMSLMCPVDPQERLNCEGCQ